VERIVDKDPAAKLSPRLAQRMALLEGSTPVEVIVEMRPVAVSATGSRRRRVEAAKAGFEQEFRGVAEKIAAVGGHVLETAWINQTIRSSIPATELLRVAEDDAVAAIDLPHPLLPDSGMPA
jgi:hypothetical protein